MKMKRNPDGKSRIWICFVVLILLCASLLCSCKADVPRKDEIEQRVKWLIEKSYPLNTVLYGVGMPVYSKDSKKAEIEYIYDSFNTIYTSYDIITPYSSYLTIEEFKMAAEEVFSTSYLQSLYAVLFDGLLLEYGSDGQVLLADYSEDSDWIYQSRTKSALVDWQRIYDYSSMQISRRGNQNRVQITLDTYKSGETDKEPLPVRLNLIYERGNWYLDSPTY